MLINREINKVVVEHKDRLVRFGFDCIKIFFNSYGVEIEYMEETLPRSFESELIEDVMSLMTDLLLNCIVEESVNLKNIGRNKKKNENSK